MFSLASKEASGNDRPVLLSDLLECPAELAEIPVRVDVSSRVNRLMAEDERRVLSE